MLGKMHDYPNFSFWAPIGPLHDPVTWYGINDAGTQITQWSFQNKGNSGWTGTSLTALFASQHNLFRTTCSDRGN